MKEYVVRALRQIEASAEKGIWEAHWGCSVIAGALLVEEKLIDNDAKASVASLLNSLLTLHAGLSEEGIEDQNIVERKPFAEKLLAELAHDAKEPRAIGHDVIYSAYVLKAIDRFGIPPWESLLDRATRLVREVKAAGPGWITINGKKKFKTLDEAERKTDSNYWMIFSNFERPRSMEADDMQLGHLLTHGHSIDMIHGYASRELSADFDQAYRKRLHGLRLANEEEEEKLALPRRKLDPRTKEYWALVDSFGDMHGHALKYAYSFLDLKRDHISAADLEAYGRILWPNEVT
ncbi:MAG TPA: hypothetical protein VGJ73_14395 [Verrucomicrobiae bacterium]